MLTLLMNKLKIVRDFDALDLRNDADVHCTDSIPNSNLKYIKCLSTVTNDTLKRHTFYIIFSKSLDFEASGEMSYSIVMSAAMP